MRFNSLSTEKKALAIGAAGAVIAGGTAFNLQTNRPDARMSVNCADDSSSQDRVISVAFPNNVKQGLEIESHIDTDESPQHTVIRSIYKGKIAVHGGTPKIYETGSLIAELGDAKLYASAGSNLHDVSNLDGSTALTLICNNGTFLDGTR